MCVTYMNIQKLFVLPTECTHVFLNDDKQLFFPKQN
jgi:hypothetical protein